jgi:hypothetical protein
LLRSHVGADSDCRSAHQGKKLSSTSPSGASTLTTRE